MPEVQLAALAWRYRTELVVAAVGIVLLALSGLTVLGSVFGVPMANDAQQGYYVQAVQELKEQKGLVLDVREPLALDAVRFNQDFSSATLQRARETVALFLRPGTGGSYERRPLDEVLQELNLTADQMAIARFMAHADPAATSCYGFHPGNDGPYLWPVEGIVTSCFGPRIDPIEGEKAFHWGVDIAAAGGTPVLAAHDGRVHLAASSGNYGNLIILINGDETVATWYGHLHEYRVRQGQVVKQGEVIGVVGSTGRSTGPHLHFEIRFHNNPVDPLGLWR